MKVRDLDIPKEAVDLLEQYGAHTLYPPQAKAVSAGVMEGKSVLVSAPTASGKTLVAILAIMSMFQRGGRRAVYLSPLRALAAEKHYEFKALTGLPLKTQVKTSISAGDLTRRTRVYGNLISMTNERMDLAIRNDEPWLDQVDLVIADEVHLIGDPYRGPTLEMILTRLKDGQRQILGLSATMTNAKDISRWLGCNLVNSNWRPVKLNEGVCDGTTVAMNDDTTFDIPGTSRGAAAELALQCVQDGGQALVFVNTRRSAPAQATRVSKPISKMLDKKTQATLDMAADRILKNGGDTALTKRLADLVKHGVAFHHAGLNQASRHVVERHFRDGNIKVISSTPTLAMGVNMPARRVIISNINRYNASVGANTPISVMEYKQLCGRAGRPQYDDVGEAITVTKTAYQNLMQDYVRGQPEPLISQIGNMKALSVHTLSLIASMPGLTMSEIYNFFAGTLWGHQHKNSFHYSLKTSLKSLSGMGMIETLDDTRWAATKLGETTSRLYLSPDTAHAFLGVVKNAAKSAGPHTLGFLHHITLCSEFSPTMSLRLKDKDAADDLFYKHRSEAIGYMYSDDMNRSLLGLYNWISETPDKTISEELGLEPGDTRRMVEVGGWLIRCMAAIARYAQLPKIRKELAALNTRIRHGVHEDVLSLVAIRNVGRVRARALYNAGARTPAMVYAMPVSGISSVCKVGPKMAAQIRAAAKP